MLFPLYVSISSRFLVILVLLSCLEIYVSTPVDDTGPVASENVTRPEVRISQGMIRGIHMVTHHGRKIFGFKAIPFAKPPIGNLRFEGPVPAEPWIGTLDASRESDPCPHRKHALLLGNEDCLYLRVYTPQLPDNESENTMLFPVMVYIYGGGFNVGSADCKHFGPHFLLDKDIILVVPSYRLSVLGFLSTGDDVSPGNYGLKDMVQALKWTKDNIRYFGGDPNQVTLVGGSSGGMSVELLTLSNLTKGLFHRIIQQSGSALSPGSQRSKTMFPVRATQLGEYFGCPTNTSSALVECLRGIDASKLVDTDHIFYPWQELPLNIWGPVVEPEIEGALITDAPAKLLSNGKSHDLPRLSLITLEEGVYFHAYLYLRSEKFQQFLNEIDIIVPALLSYDLQAENVTAYTAALKSYYLNDMTGNQKLLMNNITQLLGDALFNYPLYRSMQLHLQHKKSSQYFCSFQYHGTLSHSYGLVHTVMDWGAVHGDETVYLFQSQSGVFGPPEWNLNENDWKMVDLMVELWASFITNGTLTSTDSNGTINWEPYSSRKNHLRIGSNSEVSLGVGYNFFEDRAKFWEELTTNTTWI